MKTRGFLQTSPLSLCVALLFATSCFADLYGDPPDDRHPWQVHDQSRERPAVVAPGEKPGDPPADAIVLFDGSDLSHWEADVPEKDQPSKWRLVNGVLESVQGAGYIRTKQAFGDCQLHVEWATPTQVRGNSQGRGNSGVFLMGLYEVQVLDCYNNDTYPDGQAAAVYGQNPPLVNVCRGPGEWQTYDIIFRQPRLKEGRVLRDGYVTVLQNGVVVQDHWVLEGPTNHQARTSLRAHADKGSLKIQDHGNPVRFRNIWIRELPERSEGGLKGPYTDPKAVRAQRNARAAQLRQDAATAADPIHKVQLLMESLAYETRPEVEQSVSSLLADYLAPLKEANREAVEPQRRTLLALQRSVTYLTRHEILPRDYAPKAALDSLVEKHDLDPEARR